MTVEGDGGRMGSSADGVTPDRDLYQRHRDALWPAAEAAGRAAEVLQLAVKNERFDDVTVHQTQAGLVISDPAGGVEVSVIDGTDVIVVSAPPAGPDPRTPSQAAASALLYGQLAAAVRDQTADADLAQLDADAAAQLVRDAVSYALGAARSRRLLGEDRLDTSDTALLLGVTRQALHKRVRAGTILGVPGRGTTWFPAWQFGPDRTTRPVIARVLSAFATADPDHRADPWNVLSWADTAQPELNGARPADAIADGDRDDHVLDAAVAAAHDLAQ